MVEDSHKTSLVRVGITLTFLGLYYRNIQLLLGARPSVKGVNTMSAGG